MYASSFREMARAVLHGKWKKMAWLTFLATLLGAGAIGSSRGMSFTSSEFEDLLEGQLPPEAITALVVFASIVTFISLWIFFLGSFVHVGQVSMINRMVDGETPRAGMLFPKGIYWKSVGMNFMRSLFTFLWSLLLVIPGIIAAYSYSMADYLLAAHPEMGVMEALRESKRLMKGRRWRLFCLELSFIGWILLCAVPMWLTVIVMAIVGEGMHVFAYANYPPAVAIFTLFGIFLIGGIISMIAMMFLYAYQNTSVVIFFRDAERAGQWKSEAREGEEYAETTYGEPAWGENWNSAHGQTAPVESALSADETVARDMFEQHGCSRALLREEGLLEEYLALNPSPISEARWIRDYGDRLMRRFDGDPSALDGLLDLSAEYAVADLLNRVLSRIERHLRNQTLPDAEIVNMCGQVLALLASGRFDGDPGFVSRKKEQIADMADRLEHRLAAAGAEGDWAESIALIRRMCG